MNLFAVIKIDLPQFLQIFLANKHYITVCKGEVLIHSFDVVHIHKEALVAPQETRSRQFLLNLVEDSMARGYTCFESDIIAKQLDSLKIYRYAFQGYYAGINSMASYYKHNMELLDKDVRDELFGARDIYTKVRDSAPSKYGDEVVVKNSLISDGCEIEGTVENSILFRGVKVAKGAVIRNSIIMQDNIIGANAALDCVITDKNVVIADRRKLSGCEVLPYFIQKGTML